MLVLVSLGLDLLQLLDPPLEIQPLAFFICMSLLLAIPRQKPSFSSAFIQRYQ
jgi:hypothetical protein